MQDAIKKVSSFFEPPLPPPNILLEIVREAFPAPHTKRGVRFMARFAYQRLFYSRFSPPRLVPGSVIEEIWKESRAEEPDDEEE